MVADYGMRMVNIGSWFRHQDFDLGAFYVVVQRSGREERKMEILPPL